MLKCKAFSYIRQKYLEPRFCERSKTFKFCELMSTVKLKKKTLKTLCLFIHEIYESVCPQYPNGYDKDNGRRQFLFHICLGPLVKGERY